MPKGFRFDLNKYYKVMFKTFCIKNFKLSLIINFLTFLNSTCLYENGIEPLHPINELASPNNFVCTYYLFISVVASLKFLLFRTLKTFLIYR